MSADSAAWRFRPLGEARAELGESVFIAADGRHVWWVDTTGRRLLRTHRHTGATTQWPMPEQIGFVAEHLGHCLVGLETGLYRFDPATARLSLIPGSAPGPGMRYNDACIDAHGDLWTGTMALDAEQPIGALLRLDADLRLTPIASGFRRINGLAHHVATDRLMLSDSHPQSARIWTLSHGSAEPRLLTTLTPDQGRPDGAAIAPDGSYWLATLEGSTLLRLTENGLAADTIALPSLVPTKLAWASDDTLYITSKRVPTTPWSGRLIIGMRE